MLVEHFQRRIAAEMKRDAIAGPSPAVLELLAAQAWPGTCGSSSRSSAARSSTPAACTDAAAVAQTLRSIAPEQTDHTPHSRTAPPAQGDLVALDEIERRHIASVLRATGGNQTQAAFILGIERKTLARKIKRLDISIELRTS